MTALLNSDIRDAVYLALCQVERQAECKCRHSRVKGKTVIDHWDGCFMRLTQAAIRMIEASR